MIVAWIVTSSAVVGSSAISSLTKVELVCINNGSSDMVTTSELLQQALKEIGVTMKIQTTDAGSWLTYRFDDKAFDLCVDFTGGNPATADMAVWWQYAGNCGTDTGKTPEAAAALRQLGDEVGIRQLDRLEQRILDRITIDLKAQAGTGIGQAV